MYFFKAFVEDQQTQKYCPLKKKRGDGTNCKLWMFLETESSVHMQSNQLTRNLRRDVPTGKAEMSALAYVGQTQLEMGKNISLQ